MSHISFSANLEIVNFLSYHKALEPETFNKLYTQALGLAVDDGKIYEEPGLPSESHLKLYSNFDAIKSLDLSKFVVKKDLLEILIELCPNVKNIALGNIDSNLAGELERWPLKELKNFT